MAKRKNETVTITVRKRHRVKLVGNGKAMNEVLALFVRGAAEVYIEEQIQLGRTREEVTSSMSDRIRIAERHYKLGESDGYKCDLSDA